MKRFTLLLTLTLILILLGTGCKADPSVPPDESTINLPIVGPAGNTSDQPAVEPQDDPYPAPVMEEPAAPSEDKPDDSAEVPVVATPYPGSEDIPPVVSMPYVITTENDYSPVPGDADLDQGNAFVRSSDVIILESFPMQVRLQLMGDLPTPCNELRAVVSPPDGDGNISVEVYSVRDPEIMCTQVLEPFEVIIPIGDFTAGSYVILVNGEAIGNLDF